MIITKIRIDNLTNPVIIDRDTIKATLNVKEQVTVTFRRRLKGWTPHLEIIVSDDKHSTVVHSTDACSEERDAFNALMEKAQANYDSEHDTARVIHRDLAAAKIFKSVRA